MVCILEHLISSKTMINKLESLLPTSSHVSIISAFVTTNAVDWLLTNTLHKPAISVTGRFTPQDILSGASDLNALRALLSNNVKVLALPNLHAKIYQIDNRVFHGSANLTGKGLSLIENANIEACSEVKNCSNTQSFIQNIINGAIELDMVTINKMEDYLENSNCTTEEQWPEAILSKSTQLFVSDLPLTPPSEYSDHYKLNPILDFALVEAHSHTFEKAQTYFKNSKAYRWLKNQIQENKEHRDLGFGAVSKLLHSALCDDPAPYRKEIKTLQANLYLYLKKYAKDEIEIYMPGARSEVLKLKQRCF